MNRRCFVRVLALAPIAGAIGCTAPLNTATVDLGRIASDVADINAGLVALAASPELTAAMSAAASATLAARLADAKTTAARITAAPAPVQIPIAQGWVQTLTDDVSAVLGIISAVPNLPPQVTGIVTAIQTLLPLVEVAVALVSTVAVGVAPMTPNQARQILQNLSTSR